MPWVAPVVSALVSAAGAITSSAMTNKANRKNTELANQQNVELMNMQNEYNSPARQMERYKEAGLSPWLAANNNGNASSSPQMQAPQSSYSNFLSPLENLANLTQMVQGFEMREKQIEALSSQVGLNDIKIQNEKEKLQDWRFRNLFGYGNYDTKNAILNLQMSNLYNKYRADWNVDSPWIDSIGDGVNHTVLVPKSSDLKNGLYMKMANSSLSYQHAGTSLRNIQADWQRTQNSWGLGANVPWYVSFGRKAAENFMNYLKY